MTDTEFKLELEHRCVAWHNATMNLSAHHQKRLDPNYKALMEMGLRAVPLLSELRHDLHPWRGDVIRDIEFLESHRFVE